MSAHRQPNDTAISGARPGIEEAEAALVEHYARLVRLAYLTLPPALGRHRRVLTAHATVQRVLPGTGWHGPPSPRPGRRDTRGPAYAWVRARVLHSALAYEGRPRRGRGMLPGLPLVMGLRLFPRAGGTEELALDQALSSVTAAARAALALRVLEDLPEPEVARLLAEAGVNDQDSALRTAGHLASERGGRAAQLLGTAEFDPCTVQTRPTDLLRRRQRTRIAGAAVAIALAGTVLAAVLPGHGAPRRTAGAAGPAGVQGAVLARALDPTRLERAPDDEWADTSRVDFSAWPPRGGRADDSALLKRALRVWGGPRPRAVRVSASAGTSTVPPAQPPRLLYAGEVEGSAVVLLHDGQRVTRYAEPLSGKGVAALDFARTDDADVTTAAAVVVSRAAGRTRYLLAPWIAESATRDLLTPDTHARRLAVSPDGVTDPVPGPAAGGPCASWPALQLRSSGRIVERHSFVVTDLGDLAPVHLSYTPPPGAGAPHAGRVRRPRDPPCGTGRVPRARCGHCAVPGCGPSTTGCSPNNSFRNGPAAPPGCVPGPTPGEARVSSRCGSSSRAPRPSRPARSSPGPKAPRPAAGSASTSWRAPGGDHRRASGSCWPPAAVTSPG